MLQYSWTDPEARELLAAAGLRTLAEALAERGTIVAEGNRGRRTRRIDLDDGARCVYVKQENSTRWKDLARNLLAGRGWWTKARAELEVLRHLRARGVNCPRPLACFQEGFPRPRACLVVAEVAGFAPLADVLTQTPSAELFRALGREIARLHAAGVCQPDLYASHVLAACGEAGWQFAFLDFQRSAVAARLSSRRRIRDLAALRATVPPRLLDATAWSELCQAYLVACGFADPPGPWLTAIEARAQRLLARRKIWEIRESDTAEHRAAQRLVAVDGGRMWIDAPSRTLLDASGLADFDAVMKTTQGKLLRALRDRENWRLELHDAHQGTHGAYLKKHHVRSLATRLRAMAGLGPGETAGRVEAHNVTRLNRGGIAAMRLLAFGERLHADGRLESFVLTEELTGFTQLDHFLRARFPERATGAPRDPDLVRLIGDVADVAARFHRLGYNHRDLYCCHFFIREAVPGRFQVNLIDLQRVEHRRWRRGRWLVKDLAQLAYSAPRERIGCRDRLAFIKRYLGVERLRPRDKRFIRRILLKQRLMEMTQGMHP